MMVPNYYEDVTILHENTMAPRAYYVPASRRMDNLVEHREESDRLQLLDGNWKFRYFESIYEVTDAFYEEGYDTSEFDEIVVPSAWQMAGYDRNQYTNVRYPFPFDPPYVPKDVPCGAYIHKFFYNKEEKAPNIFLNFEGVDSCFYVWLNGTYVGYSQVSHATSEFDVTLFLKEGENSIAVLVLKWCDGSYLEDQDKFRMSGIFRDVYLLKRPEKAVCDYRITTDCSKESANIKLDVNFYEPIILNIKIEDQNGVVVSEGQIGKEGTAQFEIMSPKLWNTENPYLYTLLIETEYETIVDYIALRTIEVQNSIVYFNGQKIKFRGVNRHDFDPVTGCTIGVNQIKKDLTLMKEHNFNAIRCSHYPNAPYFYQMCDKYGFMVIDEADIEAHGSFLLYRKEDTDRNRCCRWNEKIADDPAWEQAILDRVKRMVQRDKNRFCIVMWSMGNESAYGCNFEKALEWTKMFDSDRLTQYEGARYRNYNHTYRYENLDLYSRMYPALAEIQEYIDKDGRKPFLLVEYCHSMGNGPGDLEDYFQMIQKSDLMCGGFVWEWCDHAIDHGKSENGKTMYYYGGDHAETIHDGNFCVDGLVYPDRTPHTGLFEYKNVYRPARVVSYDQQSGTLILHNYMDFDDLSDYAHIFYEVSQDGFLVEEGKLSSVSIAPHSDGKVECKVSIPEKGKVYLKLIYRLKKEIPLLKENHKLGFEEIRLYNADGKNQQIKKWLDKPKKEAELQVQETDVSVVIKASNFTYTIDKRTALFKQIQFDGRNYLNHPMELNIWRAPTDNDRYVKSEWEKAYYDKAYAKAYTVDVRQTKESVTVFGHAALVADAIQKIMDIKLIWTIDTNGKISSQISAVKDEEFPNLPRFGVRLFLDPRLEQACYYGMGPQESYRDKHRAASHGRYCSNVYDMHEDYIRPQENGSHYDCDYIELSHAQFGIVAIADDTFSFHASHYTQEELERAAHNYELVESDSVVLCLDYALNGIGSNSCGPDLLEVYQFNENVVPFGFTFVPFTS